jgi:Protein of unknown function (DUF1344)
MRSFVLPLALIASLSSVGLALAATTAEGTIKSMDMKAHTITLSNGTVYYLPANFKDPGLKVGEKVSVVWAMKGSQHDATAVTVVK